MAGLSNMIANSASQATTLPSWMDTAQQAVVNQATTGAAAMPTLQNTVAGQAINTLNGPSNPFTQAQGSLNTIASGAANPWLTDASGNVTPNTNTAMGGLFQAQNQSLQQLMPNYTAPVTGSNIAAGQFGSLRGETAVNKAMGDAQAQLFDKQMQAALQNQQTGTSAAGALGNVGSQGITSATNLGQLQQTDPMLKASTLGKVIGGIQAPTTVNNTTQVSPLNQIGSLVSALGGGVNTGNAILKSLYPAATGAAQATIGSLLSNLFSGISNPGTSPITYGTDTATQDLVNTGATALDDTGNIMPGWTQDASGSYTYTG